jgi:hypothetical protein
MPAHSRARTYTPSHEQLFWEEAEKSKALLASMPKFQEAIRAYVIGVIAMTYQV